MKQSEKTHEEVIFNKVSDNDFHALNFNDELMHSTIMPKTNTSHNCINFKKNTDFYIFWVVCLRFINNFNTIMDSKKALSDRKTIQRLFLLRTDHDMFLHTGSYSAFSHWFNDVANLQSAKGCAPFRCLLSRGMYEHIP